MFLLDDCLKRARDRDLKKRYRDELTQLLERYAWQVFASMSWRYEPNLYRAQFEVTDLVTAAAAPGVGPRQPHMGPFAYCALEHGDATDRLNAHALIGGLSGIATKHRHRDWKWGTIEWEPYEVGGGAAGYVAKKAYEAPENAWIIGTPRRRVERKRGRRGRGTKGSREPERD